MGPISGWAQPTPAASVPATPGATTPTTRPGGQTGATPLAKRPANGDSSVLYEAVDHNAQLLAVAMGRIQKLELEAAATMLKGEQNNSAHEMLKADVKTVHAKALEQDTTIRDELNGMTAKLET